MDATEPVQGITDFSGRVAFVTGARGIGLGITRALLRREANVALVDVDARSLEQARKVLDAAPERLRTYVLDVASREQYAAVGREVQRDLGEVTLLFNNAGIIDSASPSSLSYEMWDHVMGINLAGVYNGIQTFLPGMLAAKRRCHIVSTASEAGLVAGGSGFLYHASKYAVVGMSESFRLELGPLGIGVSVLFPGPVATDIVENTRKLRPDAAPTHTARVKKILDQAHQILNSHGASPDHVGELVLDAVERDAAYVATRDAAKEPLRARTEDLVAAMDYATEFLARFAAVVGPAVGSAAQSVQEEGKLVSSE